LRGEVSSPEPPHDPNGRNKRQREHAGGESKPPRVDQNVAQDGYCAASVTAAGSPGPFSDWSFLSASGCGIVMML
jgi:hypothetical protein